MTECPISVTALIQGMSLADFADHADSTDHPIIYGVRVAPGDDSVDVLLNVDAYDLGGDGAGSATQDGADVRFELSTTDIDVDMFFEA